MEWLLLMNVLDILTKINKETGLTPVIAIIAIICTIGLIAYINEKGKNIATKSDIEKITKKQEEIINEISFRYNYNFERYSKLYSSLYAMVMQSEYIRKFIARQEGVDDFESKPFCELSEKIKHYSNENQLVREEDIKDKVTCSKKMDIVDLILTNEQYSSQDLVKWAREYAVIYKFYSGNEKKVEAAELQDYADEEELRIIKCMIKDIVREYNQLRKSLHMDYDEDEIETGVPKIK